MSFTFIDGVEVASPPPDNMVAHLDFDHPQRTGQAPFFIANGVGLLIAFLFYSQKLYTSLAIKKHLALDDCELKLRGQ